MMAKQSVFLYLLMDVRDSLPEREGLGTVRERGEKEGRRTRVPLLPYGPQPVTPFRVRRPWSGP